MPSQSSLSRMTLEPMTLKQAKALLKALLGGYPNFNLHDPEAYIATLCAILTGYPLWAGERGIQQVQRTTAKAWPPTAGQLREALEDQVKAHRYAAEWREDAARMIEHRRDCSDRPTYEELKAKYGPNWGIGQGPEVRKWHDVTLDEVRAKYGAA